MLLCFLLYMNCATAMCTATTTKAATAAAMLLMMTVQMTTAIPVPGIGTGKIRRGG